MSKRQFKPHASSSRAGGGGFEAGGFGNASSAFQANHESVLSSYITEWPDLSSISDPNVVVVFKNLTKKDGTTKAKALEELQTYVSRADAQVEDAILDAWAILFPRLSIETTRRVRQLCHVVNGQICSKCGKRTVKHMPRISGPWLAGMHDNDRAAARAAQEALHLVFPTPEKVQGVRRTFQRPILEFCRDAISDLSVNSLSDERFVTSADAESTWARVMASALALVGTMVRDLSAEDQSKSLDLYEEIVADEKFWGFATSSDAGVRRAMHRLVQIYLESHPDLLKQHAKVISTHYIYKGLTSDQVGSAIDFTQTLNALATKLPTVWTDDYTGKKPVSSRLKQYLKRGSQGAPVAFWDSLAELVRNVPTQTFPSSKEDITGLLESARTGVSQKEERFNASSAWPTYFTLVDVMTAQIPDEDRNAIFESEIMPIVRQYLEPDPETTDWSVGGAKPASIVAKVANIRILHSQLLSKWPAFGEKVVEAAKMSQPEQSKDFDKSQKHVAACGERWANLQREMFNGGFAFSDDSIHAMESVNVTILRECITLLRARNAKPFGAAAIVEEQLRACGAHLMSNEEFRAAYKTFTEQELSQLLFSPSQRYLIRGLYAVRAEAMFADTFDAVLKGVLTADAANDSQLGALKAIFNNSTPKEAVAVARASSAFQDFVSHEAAATTTSDQLGFFAELVRLRVTSEETTDKILSDMTASLSIADRRSGSLETLDVIASSSHGILQSFMSRSGGSGEQLLPQVLQLEQSQDEPTAEKASALASKLSSVIGGASSEAKYSVLMQNLERTSAKSLPIDAVFDLMDRLFGDEKSVDSPSEVMPSLDIWRDALAAVLRPLKPSMALSSSLGGAIHFMKPETSDPKAAVQFDVEGFSQALRIAMYMSRLILQTDLLQKLNEEELKVMSLLHLSVLIAEDNLSILENNALWKPSGGLDAEALVLEFTSEANGILRQYLEKLTVDASAKHSADFRQYLGLSDDNEAARNISPLGYYHWLASSKTMANLFELHGHSTQQTKSAEDDLRRVRSSKNLLEKTAFVISHQQPLAGTSTLNRLCNELVADLTDIDIATASDKAFEKLVLLNNVLQTQDDAVEIVAKQRIIFLVKHILPWLASDAPATVRSEVYRALSAVLPGMQDMYGEHWEQTLSAILSSWSSSNGSTDGNAIHEDEILLISTSLRLFPTIRKLAASEDPNDDLVEAMQEKKDAVQAGLIRLLKNEGGAADEAHLPLMTMHELLGRQIAAVTSKQLEDIDELYPLLYTPSHAVQQAAFTLLHQYIPAAQEQISFDAALDNKTAQLPDELLSLVLEAPTLDTLSDASFDRRMPLSLQGYLSSWRLIFDHFTNASHRVRNDYTEQLKEGTYLSGLLSLTFDFLGHTRGKPIDASKFAIQAYEPDTEPSPERDVQWLLTHLYFLSLTHLSSQVKTFYRDLRSRQTVQAVESWTAKFISPLVITAALADVARWAETSVAEDPEYEKMSVKVGGPKSREVNAGFLVDEQTMAIRVVLPEAYPLDAARVLGVSRVAVKEEKWQSWLRNCQGVITFSNGSIADGLAAWRRNVTGALKGQTECAICYSIISADKQLPTKKCPTCKHLFHSSCLFKWFKTSNANTCPLCRNPFQFN